MPPDEGTAGQSGNAAAGQQSDGEGSRRDEETKLRQELAEQKALQSKALPWVNVAVELQKQAPETFQKLVNGEPLTKAESKQVATAQSAAGDDDKPLTRGEFKKMMQESQGEMLQQMNANSQAAKAMDDLDVWAVEELPGYENVKGTPDWGGILSSVLGSIENGTFKIPDNVKDPYKFAMQATYDILKSRDPELLKGARRGKSEEDRAAEILAGKRTSSPSKALDQKKDIPEEIQRELDIIASVGQGKGQKFSP